VGVCAPVSDAVPCTSQHTSLSFPAGGCSGSGCATVRVPTRRWDATSCRNAAPLSLTHTLHQVVACVAKTAAGAEADPAMRRGLKWLREAVSFLGDAKSSLGDAKSSLGDDKSSLGDAKSSLGDAKSSLSDARSSLGDAESSLGDVKSTLGDAKSLLGGF
jgi:hypothetical protein